MSTDEKIPTPRTDAIWKASIDDTGCVTRMEPIWNGLEAMEREIIEQRKRIEELETLLRPIDQEKAWWAVYAQKLKVQYENPKRPN